MVGYVFDESWSSANRDRLSRFIAMTRAAKDILTTSDAEWETIAPLTGAADAATLHAYRDPLPGRNPAPSCHRRGKPMPACSTACWPRSAAANSSGRRRSCSPAPSITPHRETEVLRLLSLAVLLGTWWIAALMAGSAKLPPPPAVLATVITEAESGALFLHLGVHAGARRACFVLAMSLGSAIGYLMGRVRLAQSARRSLADPAAQTCRHWSSSCWPISGPA